MAEVQTPSLLGWAFSLGLPLVMIGVTTGYLALTTLLNPHLLLSLDISSLRSKSFALFWSHFGPIIANDFPTPHLDEIITQHCRGTVLDIGPGAGFQVKRFHGAFNDSKIDTIWAIEPGTEMHAQLRHEAVKEFGSDVRGVDIYRILGCGAQPSELVPTLARYGLLDGESGSEGVFDTIVCLRALCGIPQLQETVNLFYRLLKPGGRIIFFEHVVNCADHNRGGSFIARFLQYVYMIMGWSFWNGGCELTRDTARALRAAAKSDGGWAQEEVFDRNAGSCIPEIYGYMQKNGPI